MSSVETVGKDGHELKLDGLNFALLKNHQNIIMVGAP